MKGTSYRWLNLKSLFENLYFEDGELVHLRYFTAKVSHKPEDLDIHVRQDVYLRALSTIPEISIHYGQFKMRTVPGNLLDNKNKPTGKLVRIQKFEEKGSDVNLAIHMLADGFLNKYDAAVLVSNDSDLAGTLDLIKQHIKKPVGIAVYGKNEKSITFDLRKRSVFHRLITDDILKASQFPEIIDYGDGKKIHKPRKWI